MTADTRGPSVVSEPPLMAQQESQGPRKQPQEQAPEQPPAQLEQLQEQPQEQPQEQTQKQPQEQLQEQLHEPSPDTSLRPRASILRLPNELLLSILEYLPPPSLALVGATCHRLNEIAETETLWREAVQSQLPPSTPPLEKPYPYSNFRGLYGSLDPFWFLVRQAIWFCDTGMAGLLVLFRFDSRRGCIEAYQVAAERQRAPPSQHYQWHDSYVNTTVPITMTWPSARLHLDMPYLQFSARPDGANILRAAAASAKRGDGRDGRDSPPRFATKVVIANESVISSIIKISLQLTSALPANPDPPVQPAWPPSMIPASSRVASFPEGLRRPYRISARDVPSTRGDMSDRAFRIVRERNSEDGDEYPDPGGMAPQHSWHLTFSTLDTELYTPTEKYPYRGIWAGNYGPHGCEFLLLHQPGDDLPARWASLSNTELGQQWERDATWEWRRKDPATYRSDIIGIKLTGDPNVPRGECSFVVPDIKDGITVAGQDPIGRDGEDVWAARSLGHVANHAFRDDSWLPGRTFLLSPDRIAHLWVSAGIIVFLQRVNVDMLRQV